MDLKEIEKLMKAMEESSIKRVKLKRGDSEVELEKECVYGEPLPAPAAQPRVHHVERAPATHPPVKEAPSAAEGTFITSPMVGTFYSSPSPDDPPFVKVGDSIEEDTVLCIIEAMKVMNEVKAGVKGKIVDVLMKNGDPVEFGSNIFRIES